MQYYIQVNMLHRTARIALCQCTKSSHSANMQKEASTPGTTLPHKLSWWLDMCFIAWLIKEWYGHARLGWICINNPVRRGLVEAVRPNLRSHAPLLLWVNCQSMSQATKAYALNNGRTVQLSIGCMKPHIRSALLHQAWQVP